MVVLQVGGALPSPELRDLYRVRDLQKGYEERLVIERSSFVNCNRLGAATLGLAITTTLVSEIYRVQGCSADLRVGPSANHCGSTSVHPREFT